MFSASRRNICHALEEGCRYRVGSEEVSRRRKKETGERAKAGHVRDFAFPAVGVVDLGPIIDDDLALDADVPTIYDEPDRRGMDIQEDIRRRRPCREGGGIGIGGTPSKHRKS